MSRDVDMAGAAAVLHRSYSWFQKNWRTLRHATSGEDLPRPFIGGEPGGRPWWRLDAIEAWKDGRAQSAAPGETSGDFAQREAANDPRPHKPSDRVSALLRAAGG